jgi:hypothetical protein
MAIDFACLNGTIKRCQLLWDAVIPPNGKGSLMKNSAFKLKSGVLEGDRNRRHTRS